MTEHIKMTPQEAKQKPKRSGKSFSTSGILRAHRRPDDRQLL
jgi:hypothetical protein